MSALSFEHVSHAYGAKQAVRDVSFTLARGEMVCLLGRSGCGKTTLLRLAAGLEVLQQGRIEIGGDVAADSKTGVFTPPEKRHVGLCFQDFALFPHLSVMDNILFGVGDCRAKRKEWAQDMLNRLIISNVSMNISVIRKVGDRCCILGIACVGQKIVVDDPVGRMPIHPVAYEVAADKT